MHARTYIRTYVRTYIHTYIHTLNEQIHSDSSQLFFRCYFYFVSAAFVVQCISVLSGAGFGCMIESVTIK